jgi:hypothetical protein
MNSPYLTTAILGTLALSLSCAGGPKLSRMLTDQMQQDMKIQQACSMYVSGTGTTTQTPSGFIGTDKHAIERLRTNLIGYVPGDGKVDAPWENLIDHLKILPDQIKPYLESNVIESDDLRQDIETLLVELPKIQKHIGDAQDFWENQYAPKIRDLLNDVSQSGALDSLNDCARYRLTRDDSQGNCSFSSVLQFSELIIHHAERFSDRDATAVKNHINTLIDDAEYLANTLQKINQHITIPTPSAKDNVDPSEKIATADKEVIPFATILDNTRYVMAEAMALGGVFHDGERAIEIILTLKDKDLPPEKRLKAVAQMLVSAHSDSIVDAILFWLGKAVGKVEQGIAKLDESAYGIVGITTNIAMQTKAVDRGLCTVAAQLKINLVAAGLDSNAFAARVCHAVTDGRDRYPSSTMMTKILYALVFAANDVSCSKEDKSVMRVPDPTGDNNPATRLRVPDPVPRDAPLFEGLGSDAQTIAASNWSARVTLAENRLADTSRNEFTRVDLPSLNDIPPMLAAAYLLTERQFGDALPDSDEDNFPERHKALEEQAIALAGPYSDVPFYHICDRRLAAWADHSPLAVKPLYACYAPNDHGDAPNDHGDAPHRNQVAEELRKISSAMCDETVRRRRLDASRSFCESFSSAGVDESSRADKYMCVANSSGAMVDIRANFENLEILSEKDKARTAHRQTLQRLGHTLDLMLDYHSMGDRTRPVLRVYGRASGDRKPSAQEAKEMLKVLQNSDLTSGKLSIGVGEKFKNAAQVITLLLSSDQGSVRLKTATADPLRPTDYWTTVRSQYASEQPSPATDEDLANHLLACVRGFEALAAIVKDAPHLCEHVTCVVVCEVQPSDDQQDAPKWRSITAAVTIEPESMTCTQ